MTIFNPCTRVKWSAALLVVAVASQSQAARADGEAAGFSTEHRIAISGKTVRYTATAGETLLRDGSGNPTAAIWSMAYVVDGAQDSMRPIVFVFSGGPGSASGAMNIGYLGPKIVRNAGSPTDDGGTAPFELIDNPNSVLDVADFVFVDPVGTGFSRALGAAENADFWSMSADTASMADFIHKWVTENQRWNSPKYILGLSYGSTRAVSLARKLSNPPHEMALNGLMLHGPALDFIALDPIVGNPLSYVSFFPTMAAIAHYHGKVGNNVPLDEFLEQARQFATADYFSALMAGSRLAETERRSVADQMSAFTGLESDFILNARLRVSVARFRTELFRDAGQVIGYSDGRYVSPSADPNASEPPDGDPAEFKESHSYGAAINRHLISDLGVRMDRPYKLWNATVGRDWTWSPDLSVFANPQAYRQAKRTSRIEVAGQLAWVMRRNKAIQVQVAVGYYDLYTPFFDSERVFANFGIDRSRIEINYYPTGHRLWYSNTARVALVADIRRFLTEGLQ